ncbi:MAG: type II toxin-antitoxin system RelE/ParE family toxin [Reichenbachiella sp.]
MIKIQWSPNALEQVEKIIDYISLDSIDRAQKWANSILDAVDNLSEFPESGRVIHGITNENIREIIKGNYRIVYQISKSKVDILVIKNFKQNKIFD